MLHKFFAKTQFLGKKIIYLPQCHSTNDIMHDLASKNPLEEGTTVITPHQTTGRGQRGNTWESKPNQNITFSFFLKPNFIEVPNQFHLHIVSSIAIHKVLSEHLGSHLTIKWPNDIYYKNQKLGGILIENSIRGNKIESSVIGIGINVNQMEFENENATSLKEITFQEFEPNEIIEKILIAFELLYKVKHSIHDERLLASYLRRLYQYNSKCQYKSDQHTFEGTITGISKYGKLQINYADKTLEFDFKEIEFLRG